MKQSPETLFEKYHALVDDYGTYPPKENWSNLPFACDYEAKLKRLVKRQKPVTLNVQIPFCQKDRHNYGLDMGSPTLEASLASEYPGYLAKEMDTISDIAGGTIRVDQLYFGGGIPTLLSPEQLGLALSACRLYFDFTQKAGMTFEADAKSCTQEHILLLYQLGFSRIVFKELDLDLSPWDLGQEEHLEHFRELIGLARQVGYKSVQANLHFGLPGQTVQSVAETFRNLCSIRPDRVALYDFGQRLENRRVPIESLPSSMDKAAIQITAAQKLEGSGYSRVGTNLFTLPGDELAYCARIGILRRNFTGYTSKDAPDVLGVGLAAHGFLENQYFQNTSQLETYLHLTSEEFPPRGPLLRTGLLRPALQTSYRRLALQSLGGHPCLLQKVQGGHGNRTSRDPWPTGPIPG